MTKTSCKIVICCLAAICAICLTLSVVIGIAPEAFSEPVQADVVLSSGDNFAQKWAKAIHDSSENFAVSNTAKEIRVRLDTDWNAVDGTFSSSDTVRYEEENPETIKAFDYGQIYIPSNAHIVLDLNGHTINRGLTETTYASQTTNGNGSVFLVNGVLEIRDDGSGEGVIKGGYCYRVLQGDAMEHGGENGEPSRFYWGQASDANIKEGFGGGVHVRGSNAVLSLFGGSITENYAATGGGVCVDEYATFNMYGGHVDGNNVAGAGEEHGGGGVAVIFGGTVNMYEGSINNNKAAVARTSKTDGMGNWGGGVLVWGISQITSQNNYYSDYSNKTELFTHRNGQTSPSTFNMYGGTIDENQASFDGGGVAVIGGGVRVAGSGGQNFYHNGTQHTEQDYSFYLTWEDTGKPNVNGDEGERYAIFNMWGGTINGNKAQRLDGEQEKEGGTGEPDKPLARAYPNGGAISLFLDGAFVLHNGTINNNYAEGTGGAVSLTQGGSNIFKMVGGVISGNKAQAAGGGVNLSDWNDFFYMFGGEITDNYSSQQSQQDGTTAATYGGGVQCAGESTIYMSNGEDAIQIHDNYTYLPKNATDKTAYNTLFGDENVTAAYKSTDDVKVACDVYLAGTNTITVKKSLTAQGRTTQVGVTMENPDTHQVITTGYGKNNTTTINGESQAVPSSTYFYSNNSRFPYVMNEGTGDAAQAKIVSASGVITSTITWQWQNKEGKWTDFEGNSGNAVSASVNFDEDDKQAQFFNIRGLAPISSNNSIYVFAWKTDTDSHVKDDLGGEYSSVTVKPIVDSGTVNFNVFEKDPDANGICPYITETTDTGTNQYIAGAGNYSFVVNADKVEGVNIIICPTLVISIKQKAMEFVWETADEYEYDGKSVAPVARSKDAIDGNFFYLETKITNIRGVEFEEGAVSPGDYTVTVLGNAAYSNRNYVISLQSTDSASVTLVQNITVIPRRIGAVINHTKEYDGDTTLDLTQSLGPDGKDVDYFHLQSSGDGKFRKDDSDESFGVAEGDIGQLYLVEGMTSRYTNPSVGEQTGLAVVNSSSSNSSMIGGDKASCYQLCSYATETDERNAVTVDGEITPKHISIEEATVQHSKEYDGTTDVTVTKEGSVKEGELVGSESVELSTSAAYNSANATASTHEEKATKITVTYTLSGENVRNYVLSELDGGHVREDGALTKDVEGEITPKAVSIDWEDMSFTYGDTDGYVVAEQQTNEQKLASYAYYLDVLGDKRYLAVDVWDASGAQPAEFVNAGNYTVKVKAQAEQPADNLDKGNYTLNGATGEQSKSTVMGRREIGLQLNSAAHSRSAEFGTYKNTANPLTDSAVTAYYDRPGAVGFVGDDRDSHLKIKVDWGYSDEEGSHLYTGTDGKYPIPGKYPITLYFDDDAVAANYSLTITEGQFKGFDDNGEPQITMGVFTVTEATIGVDYFEEKSSAYEEAGTQIGIETSMVHLKGGMNVTSDNITCTKLEYYADGSDVVTQTTEHFDNPHEKQSIKDVGKYVLTIRLSAQYHTDREITVTYTISGDTITIEFRSAGDADFVLTQIYGEKMPNSDSLIAMLDEAVLDGTLQIVIHGTSSGWDEVKEQITLYIDVTGGDHTPLTDKICPVGLYSIHVQKKDGAAGYAMLADTKTFDAYGTSNINKFQILPRKAEVQWTTDDYEQGGHPELWKENTVGGYLGLTYKGEAFSGVWSPSVTNLVEQTMSGSVADNVSVRYRLLRFVGDGEPTKEQVEAAAAATEDGEVASVWQVVEDLTMRNAGWYLIAYKEDRLYGTGSQNYTPDTTSYLLINVAKAALTFGWSNTEFTYNAREQRPELSVKDLLGEDSSVSLADVRFTIQLVVGGDKSPATAKNAGTYEVTADEASLPEVIKNNYEYTITPTQFTIGKAKLNLTLQFTDKTYDGTSTARMNLTFNLAEGSPTSEMRAEYLELNSAFWGNIANFVDADGSPDSNVTLRDGVSVEKNIKFSLVADYATHKELLDNYEIVYNDPLSGDIQLSGGAKHEAIAENAAKITPADVYLFGIKVDAKDYDGTTNVYDWNTSGITYKVKKIDRLGAESWEEGLYSESDSLTVEVSGKYLDKNANTLATGIVVITGITLGGDSKDNYRLLFDRSQVNFYQTDCDGVQSSQTRVSGCTVNKAKLKVTGGFTVEDKIYNGDAVALVKYADSDHKSINNHKGANNLKGVCGEDDVYVTVEARFANVNVKWGGKEVAKYTYKEGGITLDFNVGGTDGNLNYEMDTDPCIEDFDVSAAINQRTLTLGEVSVGNKVYDGEISAQVNGGALIGVLETDAATVSVTLSANFSDADVGNGKNVTIEITRNNDGDPVWKNYTLSTTSLAATADITPRPVKVTHASVTKSKTYDGNEKAAAEGATLADSSLVEGDKAFVELNVSALYEDANAATGKQISVVYSLGGAKAGNYVIYFDSDDSADTQLTETINDGEITAKTVKVQWEELSFVYDGTTHEGELKAVAYYEDINSERVYLVVTVYNETGADVAEFKNVGNYTLKVTAEYKQYGKEGATALDGNYAIEADADNSYAIAKAKFYVYGITVGDKVYDATDNVVFNGGYTVQVIGKEGEGFYDDGNAPTITPNGRYRDKNVGNSTCTVIISEYTLSGEGSDNYEIVFPEGGALYDSDQAKQAQVSQSAVLGLTVTKAPLEVDEETFSVQNKTYDGNTSAIVVYTNGASVGFTDGKGVLEKDDVKITVDAYFGSVNVGEYSNKSSDKKLTLDFITGGNDSLNYELRDYTGTETAQITPITLTVDSISVENKTYDGSKNATVTANLSNWLQPEHANYVKFTVSGEFDDENVGTAKHVAINFSLEKADDCPDEFAAMYLNYTLSALGDSGTERTADIYPIVLSVPNISADGKQYDGTTAAKIKESGEAQDTLIGSITEGVLPGETVGWSATGVFDDPNAGARSVIVTIVLTGEDAINYVIDSDGNGLYNAETDLATATRTIGDVTISKRKVALQWDEEALAAERIYNAAVQPLENVVFWEDVDETRHYLTVQTYEFSETDPTVLKDFRDAGKYSVKAVPQITEETFKDNYELTAESTSADNLVKTATILQAVLTLVGITILEREYDGTDVVNIKDQIVGGALSGVQGDDALTFEIDRAIYDAADASRNRTVTLHVDLHGDAISNYKIDYVEVPNCVINAHSVAVEWSGLELTYTGADQQSLVTAHWTGYEDDGGDLVVTLDKTPVLDVGRYVARVQQLASGGNYTLTGITATVNVSRAENEWLHKFARNGWTEYGYDAASDVITQPQAKFQAEGEPKIEYFSDAALSKIVEGDCDWSKQPAGTYYVRVTVNGTGNYTGLQDVYYFEIAAHTHVWKEDGAPVVAPTCTTEGSQNFKCSLCGATELRTLKVLGHDYGEIIPQVEPGCTTDGTRAHYKCDRCETLFEDDVSAPEGKKQVTETDLAIAATGHLWKVDETVSAGTDYVGWTWSEDGSHTQATLHFTCSNDPDHKHSVTVGTVKKTVAPDCENNGQTTATATLTADALTKLTDSDAFDPSVNARLAATETYKDGDKLGHQMGKTPAWTWQLQADNTYLVTATFTCERCTHTDVETVTVESGLLTPATCTTDGKYVYSASVEYNEETYTDQFEINVPATGHNWVADASKGVGGWKWNEDGGDVTATLCLVCSGCSETYEISATVEKGDVTDPTCTQDGYTEYSATAALPSLDGDLSEPLTAKDVFALDGGALTSSQNLQRKDATGHNYNLKEASPATCTENGTIEYYECDRCKLKFVKDHDDYVQTDDVTDYAKGHKWAVDTAAEGDGDHDGWTWIKDASGYTSATVHFECGVCGAKQTVEVNTVTASNTPVVGEITTVTTEATCTTDKFTAYTATAEFEGTSYSNTVVYMFYGTAKGHNWTADSEFGDGGWQWTDDGNGTVAATLHLTCADCSAKVALQAEVQLTSTTQDPSCTATGKGSYSATAQADELGDKYKLDESASLTSERAEASVSAKGHSFTEAPAWTWAKEGDGDDAHWTATATFTCSVCGATYAVKLSETGVEDQTLTESAKGPFDEYGSANGQVVVGLETNATCTAKGYVALTASLTFNGNSYTNAHNEDSDVLGHKWDVVRYNGDETNHTHLEQCSRCSEQRTVLCTSESDYTEATCTAAGYTTYTCEKCDNSYNVEDPSAPATGHSWNVTWSWSADHRTATARFDCATCEETHDVSASNVVESASPISGYVTTVTVAATCESKGSVTYTAQVELEGKSYTTVEEDVYVETLAKTDHNYVTDATAEGTTGGWQWNYDAASDSWTAVVHIVCVNGCDDKQTVSVSASAVTQSSAACGEDRVDNVSATATFVDGNRDSHVFRGSYTGAAKGTALTHSYTIFVHSTSSSGGSQHTVYCALCGAEGETNDCGFGAEQTRESTCEEVGYSYRTCEQCGYVEYSKYTGALGHDYRPQADSWSWSAEGFTCTLSVKCERCSDIQTVNAEVTSELTAAPTCKAEGTRTYTARYGEAVNPVQKTETLSPDKVNGHSWLFADSWEWDGDDVTGYTAARAVFECELCNEQHKETAHLVSDAVGTGVCNDPTRGEYVATAAFAGVSVSDVKFTKGVASEHGWVDPHFEWADDFTSATVTFTCEVCGQTKTVPAVMTSVEHPATCTEGGYTVYTAAVTEGGEVCHESKQGPRGAIDPEAHVWNDWHRTLQPNCTDAGQDSRECTLCGETETRTVSANGHSYGEWQREEPGCTTAGRQYRECSECGDVEEIVLTPLGHSYGEWQTSSDGQSEERHCERCDAVETRPLGAHNHVWLRPVWQWSNNFTVATATFTCSVCGETHSEETRSISIQMLEDRTVYVATVVFLGKAYSSLTADLNPPSQTPAQPADPTASELDLGGAIGLMAVQIALLVWASVAVTRRLRRRND